MTTRDRRALVLGLVVIGTAVFVLRVAPWAGRYLGRLESNAREQQTLKTRAAEILAGRRAVEDSLHRALSEIVTLAPRLVEGHTAAESQASLGSLVSLEAGRNDMKVLRLDPLPDSAIGVFTRVSLRAEFEGDIAGVVQLVKRLETSDPMLSATTLRINAVDPASPPRTAEVLRIEMDVAGYYLPRPR